MNKKFILSVDPGKATGIAFMSWEEGSEPVIVSTMEAQAVDFAPYIRAALDTATESESDLYVVCERFVINAQTVRNSQAPFSLEQIGVLKQCLRDSGISEDSIIWQSPADAKAMFPNPALKKVGYWHRGGEGHALDALRHALLCLVKKGWKPSALLS